MGFFDVLEALQVGKKQEKQVNAGSVNRTATILLTLHVTVMRRSNSCLIGLCFSAKFLYSSWCFFSFASAFSMSFVDALSFLSFSTSCSRAVYKSFAFWTAVVDSFICWTASCVLDSSSFTDLCFLWSSSAYFRMFFTRSVVFWTIWVWSSDKRSAEVFRITRSGENVPEAPLEPTLWANFRSTFELCSSRLERSLKYSISSLLAVTPYFMLW